MYEHAATEDVIQEAFKRVLQKPPQTIDEKRIQGWFMTVTRNVTYNYLRKHKKNRNEMAIESVYINEAASAQQEVSVEEAVELSFMKEAMGHYIGLLKPEYRQLLEMKLIKHLSYKEMAEQLQLTEGAVRQRLSRARKIIKERLETDWGVGNREQFDEMFDQAFDYPDPVPDSNPFTCYYYDADNAQGYKGYWYTGPSGSTIKQPLPAPFYSYTEANWNGTRNEYRHWLTSDTGYSQSRIADWTEMDGNARSDVYWYTSQSYLSRY